MKLWYRDSKFSNIFEARNEKFIRIFGEAKLKTVLFPHFTNAPRLSGIALFAPLSGVLGFCLSLWDNHGDTSLLLVPRTRRARNDTTNSSHREQVRVEKHDRWEISFAIDAAHAILSLVRGILSGNLKLQETFLPCFELQKRREKAVAKIERD